MTQLTIKNGTFKINGEFFNFHFPQEAQTYWEEALRDLGIQGDIKVKDWDNTISETEFSDKCNQQPNADEKVVYFQNLTSEQIKAVLQREQLKRDLAKAKKKRDSIKRQGLIAFSEGVAVATIEGKADAYIATAVEVGDKVKTATEGLLFYSYILDQ